METAEFIPSACWCLLYTKREMLSYAWCYGRVEEGYSVLARTYFHAVAHHVCELLGCGAALLALHCPEAELGHPLLQCLPGSDAARFYGAAELLALLQDEQVRALRDIACQRGQMRFIN